MSGKALGRSRLVPLEWDTRHFGWPVARIEGDRLDDGELDAALATARREGVRLVYWFADPTHEPDPATLARHSGWLADRRVTFRLDRPSDAAAASSLHGECELGDWPRGVPSEAMIELARSAGGLSRFARDPRMPRDRFLAMYETWIRRSTSREIADTVIVARQGESLLGLVTVGRRASEASIGLIAVADAAQRRGIGSALLRAAASWTATAGAMPLDVVTQLENGPAVQLYLRNGFRQSDLKHVFHFWPSGMVA